MLALNYEPLLCGTTVLSPVPLPLTRKKILLQKWTLAAASMTWLGDYWKFLVSNFITIVAKIFLWPFAITFNVKLTKILFWGNFLKTWATFNSYIWSHWLRPLLNDTLRIMEHFANMKRKKPEVRQTTIVMLWHILPLKSSTILQALNQADDNDVDTLLRFHK